MTMSEPSSTGNQVVSPGRSARKGHGGSQFAAIGVPIIVALIALIGVIAVPLLPGRSREHSYSVGLTIWPKRMNLPSGASFEVYVDGQRKGSLDNRTRPDTIVLGDIKSGA